MKAQASHSTLFWALGISLALHLAVLTWRFAAPQSFHRVFEDTPLEVVLVNARSNERPKDAQALAQVSLAGGGNVTEVRMSSAPLPADHSQEMGTDITEVQRQIEALKTQQMRLLTQLKAELADLSQDVSGDQSMTPERQAREERKQQLTRQLAQIEQRVDQTQGAPRKRYVSPATKETVYALYYDKLRRTIEMQGTVNFPQARGEKLYGKLTMVITVNSQGELLQTEVASSSRNPLLDERAVAIVRSSAPFDPFGTKMRRQADQIVVVSRFMFSRDDTLSTRMLTPDQ
ncbi:energy transducer TonB [Limnohabitans sp. Jir72]|uniref:energy transducer TonB n=1 Tax=Limnohabitans sp. Jir72 TaxID=1977909 RepID=UPI000D3C2AD8|nr:TonB family protein [Limnohabitans sp. Jir72]PUE29909.1 energy transducer TonB [Limnohabitans sp. Jir72]